MKKIIDKIIKKITNIKNFYILVKLLTNWKNKYTPSEYDGVITKSFDLIDKYNLGINESSMPFTLPDNQLSETFIRNFFIEGDKRGYKFIIVINKKKHTTFKLVRK